MNQKRNHLYRDNFTDVFSICQISKDGEDDNPSKDRGEGVADADDEGVPVAVVGELVVAGEG